MMDKYHNLGTPRTAGPERHKSPALAQPPADQRPRGRGQLRERFAEQLLCQGGLLRLPGGCIHIGLLREMFAAKHDYLYRQVASTTSRSSPAAPCWA
jgi:aldehyde:ferredoxin oxidoreductase